MFDGSEQFHQFIASSRASLPISLPFPLHGNPSFSAAAAAFDSFAPPLHPSSKNISTNLALESDRSTDPWSNDELLSLLKLRSSMELWFPDFTWEHVSRKLGELGFKRSAEECKEKFEDESRHFNSHNNNKSYRILSELDEFYHPDHQNQDQDQAQAPTHEVVDQHKAVVVHEMKKVEDVVRDDEAPENPSHQETGPKKASRKRKRKHKLEMLKGFCEAVVKTMMAKQEELHNKLIEDIVKIDAEKIAREEAWKNQEMDRIKTQIEIRSRDHKSAAERQATIIQFLKHFTSDHDHIFKNQYNNTNNINSNSTSNSSASFPQPHDNEVVATPPPPPSMVYQNNPHPPSSPSSILADPPPPPPEGGGGGDDVGKRWPRDEVVALINLRCKMNGGDQESGGGGGGGGKEGARGPLWERISQGMKEMGYKRSAKRCKEKWENINKYFRKTKDSSKKRSLNSRTCPYFHQLASLYSDGTIVAPAAAAVAAAATEKH